MEPLLKLALVDDHNLFRKGLISLINIAIPKPVIILFEADNGISLKEKINPAELPDIVLMDINMEGMGGYESVKWLSEHYPQVKVLVISMEEKEESIVRMLKLRVRGYLSKDVEPKELSEALEAIANKGYYYTDFITGKLVHQLQQGNGIEEKSILEQLSEREKRILNLCCTDLTYNEIAAKMFLSPKTIDGYRAQLFDKLDVKSRVGLALFAVKHGLVEL
jgi:DNA-binding NarL/FixJ family response regulator